MSVVTLQLGQCGNQLGEDLFESLHSEATRARPGLASAIRRIYFDESGRELGSLPVGCEVGGEQDTAATWRARAVLVDTEPRVVQRCLGAGSREGSWSYCPSSTFWRQGGAGNNWAHGFHHYGPTVAEDVLDRTRMQVERCDKFGGFLALQSVAGGTGSGLGSYTQQLLREAYPAAPLISICVWPFAGGEVSVQCYNAVLSMVTSYEFSDMVLLCENERYLDICRRAYQDPKPSMANLNRAICATLLPALMPCRGAHAPLGAPARPLLRLSGQLCAHPLYRLVTARSVPQVARGAEAFSSDSWVALQRRLVQLCTTGQTADGPPLSAPADASTTTRNADAAPSGEGEPTAVTNKPVVAPSGKSVASAAFLWGSGAVEAPLDSLKRLPIWRLAVDPLQVYADPHQLGTLERSIGLLSNCQTVLPVLSSTGTRAAQMLRAGAYLHQYERHGVGREEMSDALLEFAQITHSYEQLG
eukprot:TRINITY_DN32074_c0_g1_i1.p1 TRINITY_DN32074_c0_g1~~TRINITY_DN32074_c0_g1_i1.p1  ORF type:complete len:473 (-),score=58.45 TRINITY_DN32074_c0_g1_i1:261-1679(-)